MNNLSQFSSHMFDDIERCWTLLFPLTYMIDKMVANKRIIFFTDVVNDIAV